LFQEFQIQHFSILTYILHSFAYFKLLDYVAVNAIFGNLCLKLYLFYVFEGSCVGKKVNKRNLLVFGFLKYALKVSVAKIRVIKWSK